MPIYKIYNGVRPTTAKFVAVTTGTAIKTLLQIKPGATCVARLVEWGIEFDGFAAAAPIPVEVCEVDAAATVTALATADIHRWDADALIAGDPVTDYLEVGTSATGYTASAEGTITANRLIEAKLVPPSGSFVMQYPLGDEPLIQPAKFGRIRVHAGAAVNAICYMKLRF